MENQRPIIIALTIAFVVIAVDWHLYLFNRPDTWYDAQPRNVQRLQFQRLIITSVEPSDFETIVVSIFGLYKSSRLDNVQPLRQP